MSDKVLTFHERVVAIEDGRFENIARAVEFKDICEGCNYMNPELQDHLKAYRCHCIGRCPAATLSEKLKNYIWLRSRPTKEKT